MKRVLAFILSTFMFITCITAVSFAADAEVEAVIEAINKIGVVAMPKLSWITTAKSAYDALTDEQKAEVTNADALTAAIERYNELANTDWELNKVKSRINGLAGMTEESVKDDTVIKGVKIEFREVVDGDRYPGYSNFGNKSADKLREEKSFTYEFDINVYDYDPVNGFPSINGYTDAVFYANGYDFQSGYFYIADYEPMGGSTSISNGCIGKIYAKKEMEFTLGVWHHYKVTYNGNNISVEFDGEQVLDYTATEDAPVNYSYYIQYPQWINCDYVNMLFTSGDGTTVKSPVDVSTFTPGGGSDAVTMTATTLGEENRNSIEAAYESYMALSDEQRIALGNVVDTLESALNLIGKSLCGAIALGDANSDGEVNLKDANRIIRYYANWDVEINLINADINCDGKVNLKDVNKIIRLSAGYEE